MNSRGSRLAWYCGAPTIHWLPLVGELVLLVHSMMPIHHGAYNFMGGKE